MDSRKPAFRWLGFTAAAIGAEGALAGASQPGGDGVIAQRRRAPAASAQKYVPAAKRPAAPAAQPTLERRKAPRFPITPRAVAEVEAVVDKSPYEYGNAMLGSILHAFAANAQQC